MKSILAAAFLCTGIGIELQAAPAVTLQLVGEGFVSPTALQSVAGAEYMLVSDQPGVIYKVKAGAPIQPWFDLAGSGKMVKINAAFDERGLLGFALHPDFAKNKRFFVVYTAPPSPKVPANWNHTWTLSEFTAGDDKADPATEKKLLEIDHPYFNHNAGSICFGADGYLYAAVGDGGGGPGGENDEENHTGHVPDGNAQDLSLLLGKILRVDVSKPGTLGIPDDNPFKGKGRGEIYAWGMRNPWRISFDRETHELFAADIGQDLYEEVDIIKKGGNYGWPLREGFHCFNRKDARETPEECPCTAKDGTQFKDPTFEYKSFRSFPRDGGALGISITGGYVYRGKAINSLKGKYVFADWSRNFSVPDGMIYVATRVGKGASWALEKLSPQSHPDRLGMCVPAFGEDADGELYVMTNNSSQLIGKSGKVWKIVPANK